jgi:hypothetical protein
MKVIIMLSVFLSYFCHAADLDPRVIYHTDTVEKKLNQAEIYLNDNKLKFAEQQLTSAEKKLATIHKDYAGKFDENHPIMLGFKQRIAVIKSKLGMDVAPTTDSHAPNNSANQNVTNISPVVNAIELLIPHVKQAVKDGRYAVIALSSVESNYSQYRNQDNLKSVLDDLQIKVSRINALLPEAELLVKTFRSQYPNQQSLDKAFPKQSSELNFMISTLENKLDSWRQVRDKAISQLISKAMDNIKRSENSLSSIDISKKAVTSSTIVDIEMWTINYYGYLIDAVDIVFQEQTKDTPEALQLSIQDKKTIQQAIGYKNQLALLEAKIAQLKNSAQVAVKDKIKNARFPADAKPMANDEKEVARLLANYFATEPLRIGVYAPWEERTKAKWLNGVWMVETFKYLGVWMLKKNESGKHLVYQVTMRNKQKTDGTWGPMHYWTIGSSYEMLEANINL